MKKWEVVRDAADILTGYDGDFQDDLGIYVCIAEDSEKDTKLVMELHYTDGITAEVEVTLKVKNIVRMEEVNG